MTSTVTALAASFTAMLTDQAGGLLVRQVAAGGPMGELPLPAPQRLGSAGTMQTGC